MQPDSIAVPVQRKIIHVDMDCFYAAVEIRRRPELAARPVAVGGRAGQRGVLTTCNYVAREFGCRSAMPTSTALQRCPELVLLPVDMAHYREEARAIRNILEDYAERIEPLSLDEAYLDVSDSQRHGGSATLIAQEIRQRVRDERQLVMSAGVAPNKFLAKIASDWRKPDGLFVIRPAEVDAFVKVLPVGRLFGVGKATEQRLLSLGITHCGQLRDWPLARLQEQFGRFGTRLHELCWGRDTRSVSGERRRRSLSVEHTFSEDLRSLAACEAQLPALFDELQRRHAGQQGLPALCGQFVKLRFADFSTTTVDRRLAPTRQLPAAESFFALLTQARQRGRRPVRLLGLGLRFADAAEDEQWSRQQSLF